MIDGATEIISGIQGKYLDPLLLAQSQVTSAIGLIVVAYDGTPNDRTTNSSKFYDLLFLRGSSIIDCARISRDLRFRQQLDQVLATFKSSRDGDTTRIYLFQPSEEGIELFRSTFYYEPSLKVQLESLSRKQMKKLLSTAHCRRGIIECNDFAQPVPDVHLLEFRSPEDLILFEPSSKQGQLILYDVANNRQFARGFGSPSLIGGESKSPDLVVSRRHSTISDGRNDEPQNDSKNVAEQFTLLVADILKSSKADENADTGLPILLSDEIEVTSAAAKVEIEAKRATELQGPVTKSERRSSNTTSGKSRGRNLDPKAMKPDTQERQSRGGQIRSEGRKSTNGSNNEKPELVALFERTFRSFRQIAYQCLGDKWDTILSEAETQSRLLVPDLNLASLDEETAPSVLNIIEYVATKAPLLKRSRLRNAALTLIADIYNKQYELLEQQNKVDLVEQIYFRLKR